MPAAKPHPVMPTQHLAASEPARASLRDALAAHFHAQPVASPGGFPAWSPGRVASPAAPPSLPCPGDPVVLTVSPLLGF